MIKRENEGIKIFALGGLGERGKNMYVIEVGLDIFVIDAGLKSPEDEMFGVDKVIPDITYLVKNKERIKGIFLTHGHEDHIGGLAYVLKKLAVTVYGTRLTLGLLKERLKKMNVLGKIKLIEVNSNTRLQYAKSRISFFRTNHSIPDSIGISIQTEQGAIVHTSDFKIDLSPVDGVSTDFAKLSKLGREGVLCLLSDSTNAEIPGYSPSESSIGDELSKAFSNAKGRVIVSSYVTNLHRIQQIIDATKNTKRKIAIVGKYCLHVIKLARELGCLQVDDSSLISPFEIDKLPPNEVVILLTGTEEEPLAPLMRIVRGSHRFVSIRRDDTVVISAAPAPGKEKRFANILDLLYRTEANVVFNKKLHVCGHARQEELKLMLHLTKPQFLVPIQGEYRMQHAHACIAESVGISRDRTFILENGDVLEFYGKKGRISGKVPSNNVLIDGLGVGDVGNIVLRDRRLLSQDGVLIVVVTLAKENKEIKCGPEIISRGFVYVRQSEELLEQSTKIVNKLINTCIEESIEDWSSIKTTIRESLSHFLYEQTRRRPMILPVIMEV